MRKTLLVIGKLLLCLCFLYPVPLQFIAQGLGIYQELGMPETIIDGYWKWQLWVFIAGLVLVRIACFKDYHPFRRFNEAMENPKSARQAFPLGKFFFIGIGICIFSGILALLLKVIGWLFVYGIDFLPAIFIGCVFIWLIYYGFKSQYGKKDE